MRSAKVTRSVHRPLLQVSIVYYEMKTVLSSLINWISFDTIFHLHLQDHLHPLWMLAVSHSWELYSIFTFNYNLRGPSGRIRIGGDREGGSHLPCLPRIQIPLISHRPLIVVDLHWPASSTPDSQSHISVNLSVCIFHNVNLGMEKELH